MRHTGELSKLFEIDRTTLNYYVKRGLVHPQKEGNQYHTYSFSDSVALAYLRHYLGLGFHTEEISALMEEGDISQHRELFQRRRQQLEEEEQRIRLQRLFLKNLEESLTYIEGHPLSVFRTQMDAYYFVPKMDIPDGSLWMDIYKSIPSLEFQFRYSPQGGLTLPDLSSSSGISLKASWLEELQLAPPEIGTFYPAREQYLATFPLRGEHLEEDLKERLEGVVSSLPHGARFEEDFILYLFLNHYGEHETFFNCICFFTPLD